jgi:hypothetical protein
LNDELASSSYDHIGYYVLTLSGPLKNFTIFVAKENLNIFDEKWKILDLVEKRIFGNQNFLF